MLVLGVCCWCWGTASLPTPETGPALGIRTDFILDTNPKRLNTNANVYFGDFVGF